jgi:predicted nucleotidyltransferase
MRITSKDKIAGVPILSVRKLFSSSGDFLDEESVIDRLRLKPPTARALIRELVRQGFLEPAKLPSNGLAWEKTMKANALRLASAAKPIRRKTADARLSDFLASVNEIRRDEHYIYKVRRAWIFGSFLSDAEKLGDVDLAIELAAKSFSGKSFDDVVQKKIDEAHRAGRRFSGVFEQVTWPQKEVWLKLKSKSRSLSLHPYFEKMENLSKHKLIYEDKE